MASTSTEFDATGCDPCLMITQEENDLKVNGHVILSDVGENVTFDHKPGYEGLFMVFFELLPMDEQHCSIGELEDIPFMSIFRFKEGWTTHWTGSNGRHLEGETQFLLLDADESLGRPYVVILPILGGSFRASLKRGSYDNVDVCVESGSTKVVDYFFENVLYIRAGHDPFKLVKDTMKEVQAYLGTFKLLEEKTTPGIVDRFGWCTRHAFNLEVEPQGVLEGIKGLVENGTPPGFLLIDEGWQSVRHDGDPITGEERIIRKSDDDQMSCRLIKYEEKCKFRNYKSKNKLLHDLPDTGLGAFVRDIKEEFKTMEHVYVWHALMGYWGGVRPNVTGLPEAQIINGVGMVQPEKAHEFYEGLYSHLEACGIDGVIIDAIYVLEMMAEEYGGRVELAKKYYKAMTESVKKHFRGNGVIASMEHSNDFLLLGTETICLGRVGDELWRTDPYIGVDDTYWLQGCHTVHCAYNSLWMGNFIHPDWGMFLSSHPNAEFHAASRAISGGPVYVNDRVGEHDFQLLKKIVLPDGSILRCEYFALPTRDCFFVDPLHDGKTMLKMWNLNKFNGVLGLFNCQGGGWSTDNQKIQCFSEYHTILSCKTCPKDVEWHNGHKPFPLEGVQCFVMYLSKQKKLVLSQLYETTEITLRPFDYELIVVSPVKILPWDSIQFSPIGLINMLNSGGAIMSFHMNEENEEKMVRVGVKGAGELGVYASVKPKTCKVNGEDVEFVYKESMIKVQVPWNYDLSAFCMVEYFY